MTKKNIFGKIIGKLRSTRGRIKEVLFGIFKLKNGYHFVPDIYGRSSYKMRDPREELLFKAIADKTIKTKRTGMYYDRLFVLYQALMNARIKVVSGEEFNLVEVGVYRGGSSYFLASLAQKVNIHPIKMICIDTFGGHHEKDLLSGNEGHHKPGSFSDADYDDVKNFLSSFEFVKVLKGRVQDVIEPFNNIQFHFVHLDVDIYQPTAFALSFFNKHMARGGIIVVDDYGFITCPGVKKAVDDFCQANKITQFVLQSGQCVLVFCN